MLSKVTAKTQYFRQLQRSKCKQMPTSNKPSKTVKKQDSCKLRNKMSTQKYSIRRSETSKKRLLQQITNTKRRRKRAKQFSRGIKFSLKKLSHKSERKKIRSKSRLSLPTRLRQLARTPIWTNLLRKNNVSITPGFKRLK